jgi:hypothetical protein
VICAAGVVCVAGVVCAAVVVRVARATATMASPASEKPARGLTVDTSAMSRPLTG